jgi:hypothetical protein
MGVFAARLDVPDFRFNMPMTQLGAESRTSVLSEIACFRQSGVSQSGCVGYLVGIRLTNG